MKTWGLAVKNVRSYLLIASANVGKGGREEIISTEGLCDGGNGFRLKL